MWYKKRDPRVENNMRALREAGLAPVVGNEERPARAGEKVGGDTQSGEYGVGAGEMGVSPPDVAPDVVPAAGPGE